MNIGRLGAVGGGLSDLAAAAIRALFANGEQGAWYEPSLTNGTLFQDAEGTTPVTAVGQPVGLMLDKSGRGNHATQPTAAKRPVIQQDGAGKYCLAFDGVDDVLTMQLAAPPGSAPSQILIAAGFPAGGPFVNSGILCCGNGTSNSSRAVGFASLTTTKIDSGSNAAPPVAFVPASVNLFEARFGSSVESAVNGGAFTSSGLATNTAEGTYRIGLGITGASRGHRNYGVIVAHAYLSAQERLSAMQHLANKSGATLL